MNFSETGESMTLGADPHTLSEGGLNHSTHPSQIQSVPPPDTLPP